MFEFLTKNIPFICTLEFSDNWFFAADIKSLPKDKELCKKKIERDSKIYQLPWKSTIYNAMSWKYECGIWIWSRISDISIASVATVRSKNQKMVENLFVQFYDHHPFIMENIETFSKGLKYI